ncbi:MAG TPA: NYN domain-containing protein [Polyangiaceae bacterium LLY-WYZ-15_(1-7)]|mgnify:CR=1 FL=1|nr:NYN domain-containing protein [Myxococcales bacterium]MAT26211.1 NYN domain-containing protein [Sandaracinus sp.]HJK92488.1 NYN domain-containing protein [Polyangiaceae bacterium LLY-WYZ-15_(1-7)]HJL02744.1 NYN domain-containing protein [Polyangiaceae bacterium LLY-WYZ-15_(1-7)]HJL09744.1 NYN domain-containing protein [Polyangiaceae bacterium LLY-WYZ-15_(1-7)]
MSTEFAPNVAVFCDYENVAIGVRDARYEPFDIDLVLERILDKGKIVVKKAYADWDRYKSAKKPMHEAAFELIEIPHVSYSGKNSADIRMVVDALDLCYTKTHVDVFVIVSGDSDFSPLVSKLRENDKTVIGLGVKNSSSDLLIENCDEFIYYDDLVRRKKGKGRKPAKKKHSQSGGGGGGGSNGGGGNGGGKGGGKSESKSDEPSAAEKSGDKQEALELVLDVVESLFKDRDGNLWGSMVKQVLKRKRPQFSESYYGYRSFNQLLEDAAKQQLLEIQKDEKSGGYVIQAFGPKA